MEKSLEEIDLGTYFKVNQLITSASGLTERGKSKEAGGPP